MALGSLQLRKVADKSSGEEPDFEAGESWPLKHVELMAPPPKKHEFADDFVARSTSEGWATLSKGQLIIHLVSGDLVYDVKRPPGRFDIKTGKPTDKINDPDVEDAHFYRCVLVSDPNE